MSPLMLKIILMLVMVAITLIAGLVPVRVLKLLRKNAALASTDSQHRSASLALCLLTCFSGGVFLATCFLDLLPDVNEHLRELKTKMNIHSEYPFAELLSCVGFFLVFGLEEIVLKLIPGLSHSHKLESTTAPHLHVQRSSENVHAGTPNDLYSYQSNAKNEKTADGNASCLLADDHHNEDDELSKGPLLKDHLSTPPVAVLGNARILSRVELRSTQLSPNSVTKTQTNGGPLPTKRPISSNAAVNGRIFRNGVPKATSESDLEMRQILKDEDRNGEHFPQERASMVVGDMCSDEQCIGKYGSLSAVQRNRSTSHAGGANIYCSVQSIDNPLYASLALAEPERCEMNYEGRDEDPPILMISQPHAHSHGVRSVTFVLALSFHSVLEGLAFGVQKNSSEVTTLFLSLMIHKAIVAFSVGLQLARTHAHQLGWVTVSILVLALMTPLGAVIGMFVQETDFDVNVKDVVVLVFEGLAVGTFLYVTFFEVLLHERDNEHPNLLKLLLIIVGFALVGSFRLMSHGGHGEDDHGQENGCLQLNMTTASII
uniref:Uncharacterized protein n=1 Tax=Plectus sambesii TaxID=2011161 RepID=A0A914WI40_9BILA